ncbi:MAG: DUF488 domain-containing protein [Thermodesulfobacteriota bacterium]
MTRELFTIGHSDHKMFDFLRLLRSHGINALVDVRSHPVSRVHPQFNKKVLAADLKKAKITYVFLGKELGARRVESSCYVDGRAEYGRIAALPIFQEGLRRIREGIRRYRIALMCAERDPLDCHRGILICRYLRNEGISIQHIREDGSLEPQTALEKRLVDRLEIEPDLFDGGWAFDQLVEKAFDTQGNKIAYVQRSPGATNRRY